MEIVSLVVAIIATGTGVLLLVAPNVLIQASKVLNRVFVTDDVIFSRSPLFGILFLAAGIFMIYSYFAWF